MYNDLEITESSENDINENYYCGYEPIVVNANVEILGIKQEIKDRIINYTKYIARNIESKKMIKVIKKNLDI